MTLYTSDIDNERRRVLRHSLGNLLFSAFCALFGGVYEHFSFGVYSPYMVYSFVFPLIAGITYIFIAMGRRTPCGMFVNLFNSASATFAVGSISAGVIEIYGTGNKLLKVYPIVGAILLAGSVIMLIKDMKRQENNAYNL